jgi:hypothetical protein
MFFFRRIPAQWTETISRLSYVVSTFSQPRLNSQLQVTVPTNPEINSLFLKKEFHVITGNSSSSSLDSRLLAHTQGYRYHSFHCLFLDVRHLPGQIWTKSLSSCPKSFQESTVPRNDSPIISLERSMETEYLSRYWHLMAAGSGPDHSHMDDTFGSGMTMDWGIHDPPQLSNEVSPWNPLPQSDKQVRKLTRKTFSDEAHQAINIWLKENIRHPYMKKEQEDWFIATYNLTRSQLRTALNNRRQRFVKLIRTDHMPHGSSRHRVTPVASPGSLQ